MKIFFAYDDSTYSQTALDYLCSRPSLFEQASSVSLVNVQNKLPASVIKKLKPSFLKLLETTAEEQNLKTARKKLEKAGYRVKAKIVFGKTSTALSRAIEKTQPDLVVMGSHGRTPIKTLLFGSKTSAVIASCKRPLLIARGLSKTEAAPKVAICMDMSSCSQAAARFVLSNLALFGPDAEFHIIHVALPFSGLVIPESAAFGNPSMGHQEYLREQKQAFLGCAQPFHGALKAQGHEATIVSLEGEPVEQIAAYVKQNGITMLVMGTHGRGSLSALMLGSTATGIASRTDLPMLLIHDQAS